MICTTHGLCQHEHAESHPVSHEDTIPFPAFRPPCAFSLVVRRIATKTLNHLTVTCRCWDCAHCVSHVLIPSWRQHIVGIFEKLASRQFYRVTCCEQEWEGIQRRINRRGGLYVRVRLGETRMAVYFTSKLNLPFVEELTAQESSVRCQREISELKATGKRGVSTSQCLSKEKKASTFEVIGTDADGNLTVGGKARHCAGMAFRKVLAPVVTLADWMRGSTQGIEARDSGVLPSESVATFVAKMLAMTSTRAEPIREISTSQEPVWKDSAFVPPVIDSVSHPMVV